jgi:hypothetical protein
MDIVGFVWRQSAREAGQLQAACGWDSRNVTKEIQDPSALDYQLDRIKKTTVLAFSIFWIR